MNKAGSGLSEHFAPLCFEPTTARRQGCGAVEVALASESPVREEGGGGGGGLAVAAATVGNTAEQRQQEGRRAAVVPGDSEQK